MFTENTWDPWASPSRRGWMTLISFVLQAAGVVLLLVLPLAYTGRLPQFDSVRRVFMPLPPAGAQVSSAPQPASKPNSNYAKGILVVPPSIPRRIATVDDHGISLSTDLGMIGVPYATGNSTRENTVINSIGDTVQPFVPKPPAPVARQPRVSAMMEGYLVRKLAPVYPPLARAARIQGAVELQAVISKEGRIERLQVLHGPPMLVKAAIDAVQQWHYRPYILNGEPVEVETHITVNFSLLGG
ncbi:MAG TPA: energy transducer TonB [Terriglobales bacterium]|nr:energy transducer TonB [Terriglobales bacterium]